MAKFAINIVGLLAVALVGCMPHVDSNNPNPSSVVVNTGDNISLTVDHDGDGWTDFKDKVEACLATTSSKKEYDMCLDQFEVALMTGALKTGDCDDDNALVKPGAIEVCDGKDNNCVGGVDEGCTDASCADTNACTDDDFVVGKGCENTTKSCDDGNVCTTDSCNPATGCTTTPNTVICNDGDACTDDNVCFQGACISGAEKDCDDGNVCTTDACNPATGCTTTPNTATCNDGNVCTTGDVCKDSACTTGLVVTICDDKNPCTTDSCDPKMGCKNVDTVDGSCCFGNTGKYGDAFCVPSEPKPPSSLPLPTGYKWGCMGGATVSSPGHCTSCKEADDDGVCAIGELCSNDLDDDGDGLVDCEDSECAANTACNPVCATNADCDDADPTTVDTCTLTGCWHVKPVPPACTPACAGKTCGDDGCGGFCGACIGGQICQLGACVAPPSTSECVVDNDCAPGGQYAKCWQGKCVQVLPGSCGPFSISVIAPSAKKVDLEWYKQSGPASTTESVSTGTFNSHTGECSVVAWGFVAPNGCTCESLYGTSPCGQQPASPGVYGCWHNKPAQ